MIFTTLPQTELRVSKLCLGTAEFGSAVSEVDAFHLMDRFLEQGGNFLDTAHIYADWQCDIPGISEKTIGRWLADRGCRDRVIIATKGGHPATGSRRPRLSPVQMAEDLQESLRRLRIEQIDLYWLHRDDPAIPVQQILATMEDARQKGLIRWYAASNWSATRLREAATYATSQKIPGFVASQIQWSLAQVNAASVWDPTTIAMDSVTWHFHRATGLPVVAYSSQASGFFSGQYRRDQPGAGRPEVRQRYDSELNWQRLERAGKLAGAMGCSTNQIALAYLLAQPFATIPIVGCRHVVHLLDSCAAVGVALTAEQLNYLEHGQENHL